MKPIFFGLLMSAVLLFAQSQEDEKKEIKIYKRLIPADVLRGEFRICWVECFVLEFELRKFPFPQNFTTLTNATRIRRSD